MRIFAGPNGSGKTSLFERFKATYNPGYFINADFLEKQLKDQGYADLVFTGVRVNYKDFEAFHETGAAKSLFRKSKLNTGDIDIDEEKNRITFSRKTYSYEAAYLAAFLRHLLIRKNKSFSYETVMSHRSKLTEIKEAKLAGYRTYLYFICTNDPEINVSRVKNRVKKGGTLLALRK